MNSRKTVVTAFALAALATGTAFTQTATASGTIPPSTEDLLYRPLPAQEHHFAQREASAGRSAAAAVDEGAFPRDTQLRALLPALVRYFDERSARMPNVTGAIGSAFPHASEADSKG